MKFYKYIHIHKYIIIRRMCIALTSLVSTMPLTYFPRAGITQSTQDSSARCTSLSATRASIFRSPPLPLVCSRGSARSLGLSGCARGRNKEGEGGRCEKGRGGGWQQAGPLQWSAWRLIGGGWGSARAHAFHSCYDDNATRRPRVSQRRVCVCRFSVFWSIERSHDTLPRCVRVPRPRPSRCACACVWVITDQQDRSQDDDIALTGLDCEWLWGQRWRPWIHSVSHRWIQQ